MPEILGAIFGWCMNPRPSFRFVVVSKMFSLVEDTREKYVLGKIDLQAALLSSSGACEKLRLYLHISVWSPDGSVFIRF
jgi:hypothetical protein